MIHELVQKSPLQTTVEEKKIKNHWPERFWFSFKFSVHYLVAVQNLMRGIRKGSPEMKALKTIYIQKRGVFCCRFNPHLHVQLWCLGPAVLCFLSWAPQPAAPPWKGEKLLCCRKYVHAKEPRTWERWQLPKSMDFHTVCKGRKISLQIQTCR